MSLLLSLCAAEVANEILEQADLPSLDVTLTNAEEAMHSHRNAKGLSPFGKLFVEALMRKGMLVGLDHLSDQAKADTLALARKFDYPVMASHTGVRDFDLNIDVSCSTRRTRNTGAAPS